MATCLNLSILVVPSIAAALAAQGCSASGGAGQAGSGGGSAQATTAASGSGGNSSSSGNTGPGPGPGSSSATGGPMDAGAPVLIDQCTGVLDGATIAGLEAGGPVAAGMKWLYPYNKTVFPGGLPPPLLQWAPQPGASEAAMVVMKSSLFEYRGCFGPTNPARILVPDMPWATAFEKSLGAGDPVTVSLTTKAGGVVSGPIVETWTLALGSLKGTVYYNTYDSPKALGSGAVMRIKPGAVDPEAFLTIQGLPGVGPCVSCHVVSANGSKMVAAEHTYPFGPYTSASYDIQANPNPNPPKLAQNLDEAAFGAFFPDGSRLMTCGSPNMTPAMSLPNAPGNILGMQGPRVSRLFDTVTGAQIPAPGWDGVVQYAKMPMFSPDGKKIAFNHHTMSNGHTLAMMDFDPATNAFSNLQVLYNNPTEFPGWPVFTPDGKSVIFFLGNTDNYASFNPGAHGNLLMVDLASKVVTPLDRANGWDNGTLYLPVPGRDEHLLFYPTMAPVASGGYFWLYFTSRRTYGNTIVDDVAIPKTKKIWVSAIDIGAAPGVDPSHPAFYLPGQEEGSGNIRAFPSLEPCKPMGSSCTSGLDCCDGFCVNGTCDGPQPCAQLDDHCDTSADCCDSTLQCIGGFCEQDVPK